MQDIQQRAKDIAQNEILANVSAIAYEMLMNDEEFMDEVRAAITEAEDKTEEEVEEVFEWYLVGEFLANELKERGEVVINTLGHYWYGRQCTGQAVHLDSVMHEIAEAQAKRVNA